MLFVFACMSDECLLLLSTNDTYIVDETIDFRCVAGFFFKEKMRQRRDSFPYRGDGWTSSIVHSTCNNSGGQGLDGTEAKRTTIARFTLRQKKQNI